VPRCRAAAGAVDKRPAPAGEVASRVFRGPGVTVGEAVLAKPVNEQQPKASVSATAWPGPWDISERDPGAREVALVHTRARSTLGRQEFVGEARDNGRSPFEQQTAAAIWAWGRLGGGGEASADSLPGVSDRRH
jgi:hypothetical protein